MNVPVRPPSLPGADPRALMRRPGAITLLSVFYGLFGLMMLLVGVAMVVPGAGNPAPLVFGAVFIVLAVMNLAMTVGLWRLRGYGRTLLMVVSSLGLLVVPIGTIVSILVMIYMTRPGMRVLFSEVDPSRLSGDDLAALQDVRKSGLGIAVAVVLVVFGMVGGIGVAAAIAIPNFMAAVQHAKQKRAVVELQDLGRRLEDHARATGSYPAARSVNDLAGALGAGQTVAISTTDPWGHPYLYYAWKKDAGAAGPDAYIVASAGMDGVWEETGERGYEQGVVTDFNGDIVFSNGHFVRTPAAAESLVTGGP
jgi:type II secretory pathway pseudopilin PulG